MYSIVMQGNILRAQRYLSYRPQSRWSGLCGGVKANSVSIQLLKLRAEQLELGWSFEYKKFCSKRDNFSGLTDYVPPLLKGPVEYFEKLLLYRVRGQVAKWKTTENHLHA